jgi:hypothetical protein
MSQINDAFGKPMYEADPTNAKYNSLQLQCYEQRKEINRLNERIKRLEEALERLFNLPNDCCCELSNSSLDAWKNAHESLKAKEDKP